MHGPHGSLQKIQRVKKIYPNFRVSQMNGNKGESHVAKKAAWKSSSKALKQV